MSHIRLDDPSRILVVTLLTLAIGAGVAAWSVQAAEPSRAAPSQAIDTTTQAPSTTATVSEVAPTTWSLGRLQEELERWSLWMMLGLAFVFGAAGGLIYELLTLHGNVERAHRPSDDEFQEPLLHALPGHLYDLGVWARMIIGGLAAVASLWLLEPENAAKFVAGSLVAGSAGIAVFRSLGDRVVAALAAQTTAQVRAGASTLVSEIDRLNAAIKQVEEKLMAGGATSPGERLLRFESLALDLTEIQSLSEKASEIRGTAMLLARPGSKAGQVP